MCFNQTHSEVHTGKHLSDAFPIQNGLKQTDVSCPLLLNFALEYIIRNVKENKEGLEMNRMCKTFVYADNVAMLQHGWLVTTFSLQTPGLTPAAVGYGGQSGTWISFSSSCSVFPRI
jgi:hypothetical protein